MPKHRHYTGEYLGYIVCNGHTLLLIPDHANAVKEALVTWALYMPLVEAEITDWELDDVDEETLVFDFDRFDARIKITNISEPVIDYEIAVTERASC